MMIVRKKVLLIRLFMLAAMLKLASKFTERVIADMRTFGHEDIAAIIEQQMARGGEALTYRELLALLSINSLGSVYERVKVLKGDEDFGMFFSKNKPYVRGVWLPQPEFLRLLVDKDE